jgi:hypothetical protein
MKELKQVLSQYFREAAEQLVAPQLMTEKLNSEQLDEFNQLLDSGVDALVEVDASLSQISDASGTLSQVIEKILENDFSVFELQTPILNQYSEPEENSIPMSTFLPRKCCYWPFCYKRI